MDDVNKLDCPAFYYFNKTRTDSSLCAGEFMTAQFSGSWVCAAIGCESADPLCKRAAE
jgi:hypothetical protein